MNEFILFCSRLFVTLRPNFNYTYNSYEIKNSRLV